MEPQDVKVVDQVKPLNVIVDPSTPPQHVVIDDSIHQVHHVDKADGTKTLAPTTTEQEDITTAGQRRINLIWENTQAIIAITVCGCTMLAGLAIIIAQIFFGKADAQIPTIFSFAFGTVIGFYFARTNHQAIGGVGRKPDQKYIGR